MKNLAVIGRRLISVCLVLLIVTTFVVFIPSALAETYTVTVGTDYQFDPSPLTIKSGDTVKWVNKLPYYNIVFEYYDVPTKSAELAKEISHPNLSNQSYESTFSQPGTYYYYSDPHRNTGMQGKIRVEK